MPRSNQRYVVRFIGHVQGVCFRATCIAEGQGLDLNGFVRNEPDGSVLLDVEGTSEDLKELLARVQLRMQSNIDEMQVDPREPQGRSDGFRISY